MRKIDEVFVLEEDVFNSNHFGIKMGNIKHINESLDVPKDFLIEKFNNLISIAKCEGYKHLTYKIETHNKNFVKCANSQGFNIADSLVRYVFDFSKAVLPNMEHICLLSDCLEDDLQTLKQIARTSFKIDRFHNDDNLSNELCDYYYDKWIENSFNGFADKVLVAKYNNEVVGFTTGNLNLNGDYSQLILSAVSEKYRGIKVYTSMIHEGTRWLINNKTTKTKGIILGTQIDNIAVQRAWINLGYTIYDSYYVFHKYIE